MGGGAWGAAWRTRALERIELGKDQLRSGGDSL